MRIPKGFSSASARGSARLVSAVRYGAFGFIALYCKRRVAGKGLGNALWERRFAKDCRAQQSPGPALWAAGETTKVGFRLGAQNLRFQRRRHGGPSALPAFFLRKACLVRNSPPTTPSFPGTQGRLPCGLAQYARRPHALLASGWKLLDTDDPQMRSAIDRAALCDTDGIAEMLFLSPLALPGGGRFPDIPEINENARALCERLGMGRSF